MNVTGNFYVFLSAKHESKLKNDLSDELLQKIRF